MKRKTTDARRARLSHNGKLFVVVANLKSVSVRQDVTVEKGARQRKPPPTQCNKQNVMRSAFNQINFEI